MPFSLAIVYLIGRLQPIIFACLIFIQRGSVIEQKDLLHELLQAQKGSIIKTKGVELDHL